MLCPESFPETYILRIFPKNVESCLLINFPNILDITGKMLNGLQFSFKFLQYFLKVGVISAHFKEDGNLDEVIASLKSRKISF